MESFRPKKSPLSDRFLTPFSLAETLTASPNDDAGGEVGGELDEGDIFSIGADISSTSNSISSASTTAIVRTSSYPSSSSAFPPSGVFRRENFGILAALSEDEFKKRPFRYSSLLRQKSCVSSLGSSTSSARMIPPKPKMPESGGAAVSVVGGGRVWQQSAPVKVPRMGRRERERWLEMEDGDDDGKYEDEEMLPPHEIVARASAMESPMTTLSVLEGVGRTLKGRDLRRVRNAVWRQTAYNLGIPIIEAFFSLLRVGEISLQCGCYKLQMKMRISISEVVVNYCHCVSVLVSVLLVIQAADLSTATVVKGTVLCLDCSHMDNLSGLKVAIKCNHDKMHIVFTTTSKVGYFEAAMPRNTLPSPSTICHAALLGGPEQLCSFKKALVSDILKTPNADHYTVSSPLTFFSSCSPDVLKQHFRKRSSNTKLGSSKTVDVPLPPEWGLAPSSYYVPFIPIIGIP